MTSQTLMGAEAGALPIAEEDRALRVESVDTNHPAWGQVKRAICQTGSVDSLLLHDDGRLSVRQTVLVAFARDEVVGHLCFRVEPARAAAVRSRRSRVTVQARMDSFAVDQDYAGSEIENLLHDIAEKKARLLRCQGPGLNPIKVA